MEKWARINYQPCLPLGDNNSRITGCDNHIRLSYQAACEGSVLLKNDKHILPLKKGTKVSLFGKGQIDYVKGGGGSGDVHSAYVKNIYDGIKENTDSVEVFDKLSLYYKNYVLNEYKNGEKIGMLKEPELPESLISEATENSDVAIIVINRYSAENSDRKNDGEDKYYILSETEKKLVDKVCSNFDTVIAILNVGAMIDTSWFAENPKIQAALMCWQGGMEGGLAVADILVGKVNPSGKLVDTCVKSFDDYPSSAGFHESEDFVKYEEDIFVGYRYFETVPNKNKRVVYPFGFGLSYTEFEISELNAYQLSGSIYVSAVVKNIGVLPGKEIIQLYFSSPEEKITKAKYELCSFAKTKELQPGESETVLLSFKVEDMASFDDVGVISKSSYVLEKGVYKIYLGNSIRNLQEIEYNYILEENRIVKTLSSLCAPQELNRRMVSSGEYVDFSCEEKKEYITHNGENDVAFSYDEPEEIKKLIDVYSKKISLNEFISQMTDEELMELLIGQRSTGVANTDGMGNNKKFGIPSPMTVDGPAGVRIRPETGIRTTAFPIATMLACTWNLELVEAIGVAGAMETKENNLSIWLTPALNIHRSPLCGRNFEYYSEDPYISGKMAAAMVKGIQSQKIVATPKHFACNNKETNRFNSNSIVSERALREIYLKGFEICVKEAKPKLIMTSYNLINGVRSSENKELIMGILRNEWGYDGLVTTDWWNYGKRNKEISAGNDIHMPATVSHDCDELFERSVKGVTREQLVSSVKRLLNLILWLE